MTVFLRMNGWDLITGDPCAANLILELVERRRPKQWLSDRLVEHSRPRPSLELRDFFADITYEADLEALQSLAATHRLEEFNMALADAVDSMPALDRLARAFSAYLDNGDRARAMHAGTQIIVYLRLYRLAEDMGYEW